MKKKTNTKISPCHASLFGTLALVAAVFVGSAMQSGSSRAMPTWTQASSVSSSSSSRAPSSAVLKRLSRRTAIQAIMNGTAKSSSPEEIVRPSARVIRGKAAAPDAPGSLSVRPTVTPERAGCGDGLVLEAEACDDGNKLSGDGCSATCTLETGFDCNVYIQPTACRERCGNGKVSVHETCDDGNTSDGDGCSRYCKLEYGYTCTADVPNVCTTVCGDGTVSGTEQCDDSNKVSGDGCSATCTLE